MNNFEDCSLCPTVPIEHGFRRQSKSNSVEETEIHWKLIPITGKKSILGLWLAWFYWGSSLLKAFIFSRFHSWVTRWLILLGSDIFISHFEQFRIPLDYCWFGQHQQISAKQPMKAEGFKTYLTFPMQFSMQTSNENCWQKFEFLIR